MKHVDKVGLGQRVGRRQARARRLCQRVYDIDIESAAVHRRGEVDIVRDLFQHRAHFPYNIREHALDGLAVVAHYVHQTVDELTCILALSRAHRVYRYLSVGVAVERHARRNVKILGQKHVAQPTCDTARPAEALLFDERGQRLSRRVLQAQPQREVGGRRRDGALAELVIRRCGVELYLFERDYLIELDPARKLGKLGGVRVRMPEKHTHHRRHESRKLFVFELKEIRVVILVVSRKPLDVDIVPCEYFGHHIDDDSHYLFRECARRRSLLADKSVDSSAERRSEIYIVIGAQKYIFFQLVVKPVEIFFFVKAILDDLFIVSAVKPRHNAHGVAHGHIKILLCKFIAERPARARQDGKQKQADDKRRQTASTALTAFFLYFRTVVGYNYLFRHRIALRAIRSAVPSFR